MPQKITFKILPVTCHTRHVGPGSTFVCIKGMQEDGTRYIPQALAAGAKTIVISTDSNISVDTIDLIQAHHAILVYTENPRKALAELSAQAHDYPAKKLVIIGITGTKGKTTTTFLLEHILKTAGYKTALLSTVKNTILIQEYATDLTTQHPDYLHAFFAQCVLQGVDFVCMEVAAQATTLHRVDGIPYHRMVFLNFSHEHGEFYSNYDDYFNAKAVLFNQLVDHGIAIIPDNDARIAIAANNAFQTHTFETEQTTTNNSLQGISFTHKNIPYTCPALIGHFNRLNARAAISVAQTFNITSEHIGTACRTFTGVPGRLDKYTLANGAYAFIDYAHTASSFESVLQAIHAHTSDIIVVFGAGGDRDKNKRPIMGALAATYAHTVIITTDNPRSESAHDIAHEIAAGVEPESKNNITIELDRAKAIKLAYTKSRSNTVILLLGKGPDEYQLINNQKIHFSEREILLKL